MGETRKWKRKKGGMVAREEEVREGIEGAIFIPFVILLPLACIALHLCYDRNLM